jgi:hypothetical protein
VISRPKPWLFLSALAFSSSFAGRASAEPSFSDRFVRGTSPGEIPTAKIATIGSLYTLSVASVSLGVVNLVRASGQADDADAYKLGQPRGFCAELSSVSCTRYHELHSEARSTRTLGLALLGVGGLLGLGGAITAELWTNDAPVTPSVALDPIERSAFFRLSALF